MEITKVREICYTEARKHRFNLYCPVLENGRLTATLGRVCWDEEGELEKIEFSKKFLASATEENIMDVILHELAHAFVFLETGEVHGHDAVFRAMCHRLGTNNDSTQTEVEYKPGVSKAYKYSIICPACGKEVDTRSRACKLTKNPECFRTNCCNATPIVVQNF